LKQTKTAGQFETNMILKIALLCVFPMMQLLASTLPLSVKLEQVLTQPQQTSSAGNGNTTTLV